MWNLLVNMITGKKESASTDTRLNLNFTDNDIPKNPESEDVKIQIVSTKTITDEHNKKHVSYSVMIHPAKNCGILGENPPNYALIERRYTDFLELYVNLKQQLNENLPNFPRKSLTGNFSETLINERIEGFEKLLNAILTNVKLSKSDALVNFICKNEKAVVGLPIMKICELLENEFRAIDAIRGIQDRRNPIVINTLLKLIINLDKAEQNERSELFIEEALRRLESASDADILKYYVPLLHMFLKLKQNRDEDVSLIIRRLSQLRKQGVETTRGPTLEQLLNL